MNDRLSNIINQIKQRPLSIGAVSLAAGIGIGYILGKRYASETMFQVFTPTIVPDVPEPGDTPVAELRLHNPVIVSAGENFLENRIKVITETKDETVIEEIIETVSEVDPEELVTRSVFPDRVDDWNYGLEVRKRTDTMPHVIHKDEFYSNEKDYSQHTLTYFARDDIMSNEEDTPVYNYEYITGPLLFGHGSGDIMVVYVRNDKMKTEYEVLLDPGRYSEEVLGLEIEDNQHVKDLKHSNNMRFRTTD